jgi:hypothetical protein
VEYLFNCFKSVLEDDSVCLVLGEHIVEHLGGAYINTSIDRHASEAMRICPESVVFYENVRARLQDEEPVPSHGLHAVCRVTPDTIFAMIGEKYSVIETIPYYVTANERRYRDSNTIAFIDPEEETSVPDYKPLDSVDRRFSDPEEVGDAVWERHTILSHRAGALARLQGKSIGEARREEGETPAALIRYVKERRCVCTSYCACAKQCTSDAERFCPCAPRQMRLLMAKQPIEKISDICDLIAEACVNQLFKTKYLYEQDELLVPELIKQHFVYFNEALTEHRNVIQWRVNRL